MSATPSRVGELLARFELAEGLCRILQAEMGSSVGAALFQRLAELPLLKSHALTRLGSYRWRGAEPLSIRLQFAQEPDLLRQTFLHEIAHFLDHQTRQEWGRLQEPHGPSWRRWFRRIGGCHEEAGSVALRRLYRERLKPVARCRRCGLVIERLRRLPRGKAWTHRGCGGALIAVEG